MKKNQWQFYILALCFLLNSNGLVADTSSAGRQQAGYPFSSGEKLHYKLSYRGLLTSMIWADLADASMTFLANQRAHDGQTAHQFVLSLSTENYAKAEMIQPVRYTYITTLDQDLSKTLLVEEIDVGENRSHDFLWMDWQNNKTQLYKKREKETVSSGFFDVESKQVWEKDGAQPLPDFLMTFPLLENNQTYFIHKESGDDIERSQILDPLSLIYSLRTFDFDASDSSRLTSSAPTFASEMAIAVSDDIRLYGIENHGLESIKVGGEQYQAIKYKIQTDEKKDNHYFVWLKNDRKKIPLRLAMDAPLGKLNIDLVKVTQIDVREQNALLERPVIVAERNTSR